MNAYAPPPRPQTPTSIAAAFASPQLGSQSPTPISAVHSKYVGGPSSSALKNNNGGADFSHDRPTSLLTSPFVPVEDDLGSSSPHRNPFDQRPNQQQQQQQQQQQLQYEQQLHIQQQQQLQQQQQQQQQYGGGYY